MAEIALEHHLPTTTEFATIPAVRNVITQLDQGDFYWASILIERMMWNPRLRAAIETRMAGLIATRIRWEPAKENAKARRAAKEMAEDWPLMAPSPQRKQFSKWGLLAGVGFGQRVPFESSSSGRRLFRLRPYWTGWAVWDDAAYAYQIDHRKGRDTVSSPSLALDRPIDASGAAWIVHEPFGEHSWREALVHAAWRPWFGHDNAFRDLGRASEKKGVGILKGKFPRQSSNDLDPSTRRFLRGLRKMGAEGVIPCEQPGTAPDGTPIPGYDVEPLEFNGEGGELIGSALNTAAIMLAILILGHNLTTEVKGGSYAAATVGEFIRIDKKVDDTDGEWATLRPQLAAPWAVENYGDPEVVPRAIYETDPPTVNEITARTFMQLGQAIRELRTNAPRADVDALLERFRIPLKAQERAQVQVPPVPAAPPPAAPAPDEDPEEE